MAGARRALILATDDYTDAGLADLSAPELDAQELRKVLEDPEIGGFEVTTLLNRRESDVRREVARFLKARSTEDLLVHVSCHGVKAPDGQLYLATTDTELSLLSATALPASFINAAMEDSRANSILLMLDCCYAGAFAKGMKARSGGPVDVDARLGGSGRAVITATDALQFAFEGGDLVHGDPGTRPSIFTDVVVQGLRSGQADLDQDGRVTLREFFDYVDDEVRRRQPDQTPRLFIHDVSGDLFVAGRTTPATKPTPLAPKVQEAVESEDYWTRVGVVGTLVTHLRGDHPGRALAARNALEKLAADPDDRVKAEAREALASVPVAPRPEEQERLEREEQERLERERLEREREERERRERDREEREREEQARLERERLEREREERERRDPPPPPPPWWRRTGTLVAAGAATVVLVAGAVVLLTGDDGQEPPGEVLPDEVILLVRRDQRTNQLLAMDVAGGNRVTTLAEGVGWSLPTIAPDRRQIVILKSAGAEDFQKVAYVGGIEDPDRRRLLDGEMTERCPYTARPSWNAESSQLVVACINESGERHSLVVVDIGGRFVRELTAPANLKDAPSWGEDGRVYFILAEGDTTAAWSVADTGGDPVRVEGIPTGQVSHLDWGPEGLLYLYSEPESPGSDVYRLPWEGEPEQLSRSGDASSPTWSPDGTGVVWVAEENLVLRDPLESSETTVQTGGPPGAPVWGSR